MRSAIVLVATLSAGLTACGSSTHDASPGEATSPLAFDPPAALAGYTRLAATTVKDVKPGDDVTYCQYAMAPLDHDVDVLGVMGYQSKFGHHAVAFTYTPGPNDVLGASFPCMGTEFSSGAGADGGGAGSVSDLNMGTFLGGIGGSTSNGSSTSLPEGVAFRLTKGSGVMLNVHYLNTGEQTIDGNSVLDIKFGNPDPNRLLAALFVNVNAGFDLKPDNTTSSTIDCVAQSDLSVIMMTNHMHDYGTSATSVLLHGGTGVTDTLHEDPTWTSDMQFNPIYSRWPVATPLMIHSGDTVRTTCNWDNATSDDVKFPREMCVGVAFVLATAEKPTAPICADGAWLAGGI